MSYAITDFGNIGEAFTGGRLVESFNHLVAAVLGHGPFVDGGKRIVFLASDDDGAAAIADITRSDLTKAERFDERRRDCPDCCESFFAGNGSAAIS